MTNAPISGDYAVTATILNTATDSDEAIINFAKTVNLEIPAVDNPTTLTFNGRATPGGALQAIMADTSLNALSIAAVAGAVHVPVAALAGYYSIQIIADNAQAADRVFTLFGFVD